MNEHFTLIVKGEKPELLVDKYSNKEVEPYVVYEYTKAEEYLANAKSNYTKLFANSNDDQVKKFFQENLEYLNNLEPIDYYIDITEEYEINENDGNAYSKINPNKKFDSCRVGKELSIPFSMINGAETFSALKGEIDWGKMHLNNQKPYEVAWDTVMEGKKPENDFEENIYNNMKNRTGYFSYFKTRENYITNSTAFWGYAFLDENGWVELEENEDQFEWAKNFYDRFIKNLSDDSRLTIYECFRYQK